MCREEASWVADEYMTEPAVRLAFSVMSVRFIFTSFFTLFRSFCDPQPSYRIIADCVSGFVSKIKNSLRLGCVRNCAFSVPFRCDAFKFLFNGRGSVVRGKKGLAYTQADFNSSYFPPDWFLSCDALGDCCKIDFPIILRNFVKFTPQTYTKHQNTIVPSSRDFTETLSVIVVKVRC